MNLKHLVLGFGALLALSTIGMSATINSCTNITSPGNTYELNASLTGNQSSGKCIDIQADDVTLLGNGYSINDSHIAIHAEYQEGIEIKDVQINNSSVFGVDLLFDNDTLIQNVTIDGSSDNAIRLIGPNNSTVEESIIKDGTGIPFQPFSWNDVDIVNNTIVNNTLSFGDIISAEGSNIEIINNTINSNELGGGSVLSISGGEVEAQNVTVINNKISSNTGIALKVDASDTQISQNTINGNNGAVRVGNGWSLIEGVEVSSNEIYNNTNGTDYKKAIVLNKTHNTTITNNNISLSSTGIHVERGNGTDITGNNIEDITGDSLGASKIIGIYLYNGTYITMESNSISNISGDYAVRLHWSLDNVEFFNNVVENSSVMSGINIGNYLNNISISDSTVHNIQGEISSCIAAENSGPFSDIQIKSNTISDCPSQGINNQAIPEIKILNNTIHECGQEGVYNAAPTPNITGNEIYDSGKGIELAPGGVVRHTLDSEDVGTQEELLGPRPIIQDNEIYNTTGTGINAGASGTRIIDNTIYSNERGIGLLGTMSPLSGFTVKSNEVYSNDQQGITIGGALGSSTFKDNVVRDNLGGLAIVYFSGPEGLMYSENLVFNGTTIINNTDYGLLLNGTANVSVIDGEISGNGENIKITGPFSNETGIEEVNHQGYGISLRGQGVTISEGSDQGNPPQGASWGKYLQINGNTPSPQANLTIHYTEEDLNVNSSTRLNESTLSLWKHNGTEWTQEGIESVNLNTEQNTLNANITQFSTFTIAGDTAERTETVQTEPIQTTSTPGLTYALAILALLLGIIYFIYLEKK